MTIAERIVILRNKKGLSQAELARRAGIGQSTLHGYESGTRKAHGMSVAIARRLARELGVTVDYLIGVYEDGTGEPCPLTPALAVEPSSVRGVRTRHAPEESIA